jgi:hypothetical protein
MNDTTKNNTDSTTFNAIMRVTNDGKRVGKAENIARTTKLMSKLVRIRLVSAVWQSYDKQSSTIYHGS